MIVDTDVDVLPADPAAVALAGAILGDAVADPVKAAQFLDVDMDHLAGSVSFVSPHRFAGFEIAPSVEAVAGQDSSDGGAGNAGLLGDPAINPPFLAKGDDLRLDIIGRSVWAGVRS